MSSSLRKVKNAHRKGSTLKKIFKDEGKRVRLFLLLGGIILIVIGLFPQRPYFSRVLEIEQEQSNIESFSNEPVRVDSGLLKDNLSAKNKLPPVRLLMSSLDIDLPIKEAKIVKGYWEVFPDTAGWGTGSAYPDEIGNQVIFAHAKTGLFAPLKNIKKGEKITVFTKEKWFEYVVVEIKEVLPNVVEVIAPTNDETLTLYTCSGFADSKRLIVTAKRVKN